MSYRASIARRWIAAGTVAVLAAALFAWAASKPSATSAPSDPSPLAGFMPPGAMLYIEAKDFSSLLSEWNASPEKRQWLTSDNCEAFSRSRLLLRLADARKEFASAAGVSPDTTLLSQAAGKQSALALYNIGNLEFVYISRVPSAAAMQSALWQARTKFESRSAAGAPFFVHTDAASGRVVAFAVTSDYLILATREDLLAGTLNLLAGGSGPKLTGEDWYAHAVSSAGAPGDLRMVLNVEKIAADPHFRSYWIQANAKEMRNFSAAISDLHLSGSTYQEGRVLLPKTDDSAPTTSAPAGAADAPPAAASTSAQAVADLLRLVPDDAGVYRASADPSADASLVALQTKILAPHTGSAPPSKLAPEVNLTAGEVGSSSDLETRIDQPHVPQANSVDDWSALRADLQGANVQAMLSFDSTRVDPNTNFVQINSTVVLAAASDWDATSVNNALSRGIAQSASTQQLGTSWKRAGAAPNDYFELDGLLPVRVATRGKLLIVSNDADSIAAVLARVKSPSSAEPSTFAAGFHHAAEQPNFLRLVSTLDRANPQGAPDSPDPGVEPAFFSANIASLSRVLSGLDSGSVVIRESPGKTLETVIYRWK
ncbi:MAG: hypothetical protein WBF06_15235 [Candidatus Acidiferrales bacterium]